MAMEEKGRTGERTEAKMGFEDEKEEAGRRRLG